MQRNFLFMHSLGKASEEINCKDHIERNRTEKRGQAPESKKNSPLKVKKGSLAQQIKEIIGKNPQNIEKIVDYNFYLIPVLENLSDLSDFCLRKTQNFFRWVGFRP